MSCSSEVARTRAPRAAVRPCGDRGRAARSSRRRSCAASRRGSRLRPGVVARADAAVLRQPLLRDVHPAHDLHARDEPLVDPLRQVHDLLEQAVEAMTDDDVVFGRLDVDVARLLLSALLMTRSTRSMIGAVSGVTPPLRRRSSRRCRPRAAGRPASRHPRAAPACRRAWPCRRATGRGPRAFACTLRPAAWLRGHERLVGIGGVDRVDDLGARGDDLLDAVAGLELEVLDEREQQRVRHRDGQQVLLDRDGDARALERDVLRDEDDGGLVRRVLGEVDVRKPELVCERLGNLPLGRQVHPDEYRSQSFAGALVLDEGGL